jgi:acyl dehydratase
MTWDEQGGDPAALLGKEQTFQASEPIGEALIRRFAAAVGDHNALYWDDQYAQEGPYDGIVAPPTLLFELTYDIGGEIDREKGLYQGLLSWAGFPKSLDRAGNEYEIFQPVRPDDVITVHKKIVDVTEKEGRTGKWTFLSTEITYTNQKKELLGRDLETLACRY